MHEGKVLITCMRIIYDGNYPALPIELGKKKSQIASNTIEKSLK